MTPNQHQEHLFGVVRYGLRVHDPTDETRLAANEALARIQEQHEALLSTLSDERVQTALWKERERELLEQLEAVRKELSDMAQVAFEGNEREKVLEGQLEKLQAALQKIADLEGDDMGNVAPGPEWYGALATTAEIAQEALNPASGEAGVAAPSAVPSPASVNAGDLPRPAVIYFEDMPVTLTEPGLYEVRSCNWPDPYPASERAS